MEKNLTEQGIIYLCTLAKYWSDIEYERRFIISGVKNEKFKRRGRDRDC